MKAAFLPDRGVVKVSGEDARNFLNGLVTTDVTELGPAQGRFGALLTPQGKIVVDFLITEAPGGHGGGFLSSAAAQPGLSETVINNYYGDNAVPDTSLDTADSDADQSADFGTDPNADDADVADIQDFDDTSSSSFDV